MKKIKKNYSFVEILFFQKNTRNLKISTKSSIFFLKINQNNDSIPFAIKNVKKQRLLEWNCLKILSIQNLCIFKIYLDFVSIIEIFSFLKKSFEGFSSTKNTIKMRNSLDFSDFTVLSSRVSILPKKPISLEEAYFCCFVSHTFLLKKSIILTLTNFLKSY